MSIFYYIGSSKELELGTFGSKLSEKSTEDKIIYETYEDAAAIYIKKLWDEYSQIKKHFMNPFVYMISANWGNFYYNGTLKKMNIDKYKASRKCLKILFDYIYDRIEGDEFIELYSCWAGEESHPRNKVIDRTINLSTFEFKNSFYIKDRQYIMFIKK